MDRRKLPFPKGTRVEIHIVGGDGCFQRGVFKGFKRIDGRRRLYALGDDGINYCQWTWENPGYEFVPAEEGVEK